MYKDFRKDPEIVIYVDFFEETCGGCPAVYEFKDEDGDNYTFYLRNGYAYLEYNGDGSIAKTLINGTMNGFDGVCNFSDFIDWAKDNWVEINYSNNFWE